MKDFQIHFTGAHEDIVKIVKVAQAVIDEVRATGGEIEGYFSSGHLLGGSRNVDDIHEQHPITLADGTIHPEPQPVAETAPPEVVPDQAAPELPAPETPGESESHDPNV